MTVPRSPAGLERDARQARRWRWAGRTCFSSAWGAFAMAFAHADGGFLLIALVLMGGASYCQREGG